MRQHLTEEKKAQSKVMELMQEKLKDTERNHEEFKAEILNRLRVLEEKDSEEQQ